MSYFAFVSSPVSESDPCGPSLDGDADFETYFSSAEGKLPASFFSFDKADVDLAKELKQITDLLKLSRDARLLVIAAKFSILAGDTGKFADAIIALADLLDARWEDLHPGANGEGYGLREAHVASLNDLPTVVLPLQYAPLVSHRRHGTVSFRSQLIATKAVQIRDGEPVLDESSIRDALLTADDFDALKATFEALVKTEAALRQMLAQFQKRAENNSTPDLDKLSGLLLAMTGFLAAVLQERDPSIALATSPPGEASSQAEGKADAEAASAAVSITSAGDAAAALLAVETYFRRNEPSNPATLLVRQAHLLIGKSFIEAMVILNPALAEKAAIKLGGETPLSLSSGQLKGLSAQMSEAAGSVAAAAAPVSVASRAEAVAQMEGVERYFQKSEPSSPIPLLLGRARACSGKDFAALMKEVLG